MALTAINKSTGQRLIQVGGNWIPFDEEKFKEWYATQAERNNLDPNPDAPEHFYDYRSAYAAGAEPDETGHWPSVYKDPKHPNRYVQDVDPQTGGTNLIDSITGQPVKIAVNPKTKERIYWNDGLKTWAYVPEPIEPAAPPPDLTMGRWLHQMGSSVAQGVGDIARGFAGHEQARSPEAAEKRTGGPMGDNLTPVERTLFGPLVSEATSKKGSPLTQKEMQGLRLAFRQGRQKEYIDSMEKFVAGLPQPYEDTPAGFGGFFERSTTGMARFVPAMAISWVSGPAGLGVTFEQIYGSEYDRFKKAGASNEKANTAALISSLGQAPIEFAGNLLQIGALKNIAKGVSKPGLQRLAAFGEALLKGAVGEGAEEYLQNYPQAIADVYVKNPNDSPTELAKKVWAKVKTKEFQKESGEQAATGAFGGLLLAGAGGALGEASRGMGKAAEKIVKRQYDKAVDDVVGRVQVDYDLGVLSRKDVERLRDAAPDEETKNKVNAILEKDLPPEAQDITPSAEMQKDLPIAEEGLFPKQTPEEQAQMEAEIRAQRGRGVDRAKLVREKNQRVMNESEKLRGESKKRRQYYENRLTKAREENQRAIDKINVAAENELERNRQARKEIADRTAAQRKRGPAVEITPSVVTAVNPDTGERMIYRGDKWEPLVKGEQGWETKDKIAVPEVANAQERKKADAGVKEKASKGVPDFKNTQSAVAFGEKATPEQVDELKRREADTRKEVTRLKENGDFQGAMNLATKAQYFREAAEAAEGKLSTEKINGLGRRVRAGRNVNGIMVDGETEGGKAGEEAAKRGDEYIGKRGPRKSQKKAPDMRAVGWTGERLDKEIKYAEYPGDRTKAVLAWVDPEEFVKATTPSERSRDLIDKRAKDLDLDKLREESQTPFLYITKDNKIVGHEGRHRLTALAREGVKAVPIVLDYRAPIDPNNWKVPHKGWWLDGQVFSKDGRGKPLFVTHAMPLMEKYRGELERYLGAPDIRFAKKAPSQKTADKWYSQMTNFLDEKLPGSGSPKQLLQTIDSWAKKGLIKGEELDWSGLREFLDEYQQNAEQAWVENQLMSKGKAAEKDDVFMEFLFGRDDNLKQYKKLEDDLRQQAKKQKFSISKQDILDFLAANHVRVGEVEKGFGPKDAARLDELDRKLRENGKLDESEAAEYDRLTNQESFSSTQGTKFSQYQLPGGENYHELLLTLPSGQTFSKYRQKMIDKYGEDSFYSSMTQSEHDKYDALLRNQKNEAEYHSGHWLEPNVVAHVRFNERADADGNRVLFIEEIQSDWAASNRKALNEITKPQSVRELGNDVFGRKAASIMPLQVVDGGVLAMLKHNEVRRAIISDLPVDVVNILKGAQLSPEQVFSDPSMVVSDLPVDHRRKVLLSVLESSRAIGASLRAKLLASFNSRRGDKKLLPALSTSDLSTREVVGLLSPDRIYHDGLSGEPLAGNITSLGTEVVGRPGDGTRGSLESGSAVLTSGERGGSVAGVRTKSLTSPAGPNLEMSSASLANLVDWHNKILSKADSSQQASYINAPFVSSTKGYVTLAFKRMVRYAAENGYSKIAWTPGDVQADRYDLSKQVDDIEIRRSEVGDNFYVVARSGGMRVVEREDVKGISGVEELVGKDLAEKASQIKPGEGKTYSGLDLKVGGEGMKGFYDKILPAAVNKFFGKKAWGSPKVGTTEIDTEQRAMPEEGEAVSLPAKLEVWSLPITPEMRQKALSEGMPMFAKAKKVGKFSQQSRQAVYDQIDALQSAASTKAAKSVVVETQDQLPEGLRPSKNAGIKTEAAWDNDTVYFVAENIATPKRAIELWLHEQVGHKGITELFANQGADFNEFLDFAYDTIKRSKDVFESVKRDYADDLEGMTEEEQKRLITEEVIARRAEKLNPKARKNLFQKLLDWINGWIAKFKTGDADVKLNMSDLDRLLEAAKNRIILGDKGSRVTDTPAFKKWFGGSKVVDENGEPLVVYHGAGEEFNEFKYEAIYSGEGVSHSGSGFYFTTDKENAERYMFLAKTKGKNGAIQEVYLSIKNPIEIDWEKGEVSGANIELDRKTVKKIIMQAPNIMDKDESPLTNFNDIRYYGFNKVLNEAIDTYVGANNIAALRNDFFDDNYEAWLKAFSNATGYDGAFSNLPDGRTHWIAWFPTQIKSATGNRGTFDPKNADIRFSKKKDEIGPDLYAKYFGRPPATSLTEPPKPVKNIDVEKASGKSKIAFTVSPKDFTVEGLKKAASKVYTTFFMQEFPVKRFAAKAGPEYEKAIEEQLRRIYGLGGIVEAILTAKSKTPFIELAKIGIKEYSHLGDTSLKKILEPLKTTEVYQDYERLREATRDLAFWNFRQDDIKAGKLKGIDPDHAKKVLWILDAKYGSDLKKLQDISRRHTRFEQDAVLKTLLKSGWMSQERYDAIMDRPESEFYASYLREMEEVDKQIVERGGDPVKRIYGSERRKLPSVEGTIANILRTVRLVERLRLNKQLVDLKNVSDEFDELIQEKKPRFRSTEVTFPQRDESNKFVRGKDGNKVYKTRKISVPVGPPMGTITVAEDGKKQYYTMPAEVLNSLDNYSPKEANIVFKLFTVPTRLLRAGATLSAEFMMRNPARDQFTAFVYSKYGYNPFVDFAKGLFHAIGKTDMYQEFKAAGAENSYFVSLDRHAVNLTARDMIGAGNKIKYVKNPIEALRVLSELSEKGTRVGLYARARGKGATPLEAVTEAREGTLDFGRIGTEKALNQLIAFWNANLQGTDKLFREMRNGRAILRATMGITVPSIALWFLNHDEDRYKEIPEWRKNFFWNILPESAGLSKDLPIISIPKPFELGLIFGSLPERVLDWIYLNDKNAVKDIAMAAWEGLAPGVIFTWMLPGIEHLTNYSFFRGQKLEPRSLEDLPNWMRYTSGTTNLAKKAGKMVDVSPIKLENWARDWTGTLGSGALAGFDKLFMGDDIPDVGKNWYELTPGLKGFIAREPIGSGSKSVEMFYENAKEALAAEAGYKFLAKRNPEDLQQYLKDQNKLITLAKGARTELTRMAEIRRNINKIIDAPKMTPKKKREEIDKLNRMITKRAQMFNQVYDRMTKEK